MRKIAPTSVISRSEVFSRRAPPLTLVLHEASSSELAERLLAGELDVAITALPTFPEELQALPLFEEAYVITFPRGHRFAQMAEVPLNALAGERYLSRLNCEYLDMFEAARLAFDVEIDERFKSQHESWVQAMVIAGLNCAIMPESLALHPELHSRPLVDPIITRTISAVTRRGRRHTPVVDFFVSLCKRMDWGVNLTRNAATVPFPTS